MATENLTVVEKLEKAFELIKEAEKLVKTAQKESSSLSEYYGYSLKIIQQELNRFSDNSADYLGKNTNLQEIIDDFGTSWR